MTYCFYTAKIEGGRSTITGKRIHVNHSRYPLSLIKKKIQNKPEKTTTIKKINEKIKEMDDLFDEEDFSSLDYELTSKQSRLLKIIYLDDVDAEHVTNNMKISDIELKFIVNDLVKLGLLKYTSNDEIELTDEGIYYITSRNLDLF